MKTYILLLDMLILSFLILAIHFNVTDNTITDSYTGRRETIRTIIISWQSLILVASFCVFLRYIAHNRR